MDTSKVEFIKHKGRLYAIIVRSGYTPTDSDFFTEPSNDLQLGFLTRSKDVVIRPHFHINLNNSLSSAQEFIHLLQGEVEIKFFTKSGKKFASSVLISGDSILSIAGGHGFHFLEKSIFFEIKQGPQPNNIKRFYKIN